MSGIFGPLREIARKLVRAKISTFKVSIPNPQFSAKQLS